MKLVDKLMREDEKHLLINFIFLPVNEFCKYDTKHVCVMISIHPIFMTLFLHVCMSREIQSIKPSAANI